MIKRLLGVNNAVGLSRVEIGLVGLYIFSFGLWCHRGIAKIGIALMLVGVLLAWRRWSEWVRIPVVWLTGLWLLYLFIRMLAVLILEPRFSALHGESAVRLMWLAGFLLPAFYLQGQGKRIFMSLLLAGAGFFVGRFFYLDEILSHGRDFWRYRYELGFPTAIPFGQYSAAVVIGLLALGPRIWRMANHRVWIMGLWLLMMAIALECVILSQSRSVWGAFAVVLPIVLILGGYVISVWRRAPWLGTLALAIVVSIGIGQSQAVVDRFQEEKEVYVDFLQGGLDSVPIQHEDGREYSVGVRLAMWRFGIEHWLEKPWFGWGPGATKMLIACCAPEVFKRFNDLHSAYVEILLRLGLVGFFLTAVVVLVTVAAAFRAFQEGRIENDLFAVLVGALLLHMLVSVFNFRMLNYDWRFYWFLFGGIAASFMICDGRIPKLWPLRDELPCWVPCDHIPRRSYPLFRARDVLSELIAEAKAQKVARSQR